MGHYCNVLIFDDHLSSNGRTYEEECALIADSLGKIGVIPCEPPKYLPEAGCIAFEFRGYGPDEQIAKVLKYDGVYWRNELSFRLESTYHAFPELSPEYSSQKEKISMLEHKLFEAERLIEKLLDRVYPNPSGPKP